MRWQLIEEEAPRLPGFVERVQHPEFAGIDFLHVRAKSIINSLPKGSRLPFRHTINVYRGCTHACVYCLSGETPILMGDGRTRPLADVEVGDAVYGTVRRGTDRRYVVTRVLDRWSTVTRAYRVTLEDGTELVASDDHRFLTGRGWKHVKGAERGQPPRPHLTGTSKLVGTGRFAPSPRETPGYQRGYLCGMVRLVDLEALQRSRRYLTNRGVDSKEFVFQRAAVGDREMRALRTQSRGDVTTIKDMVAWPRDPTDDWCRGFLAGIFDAEGTYSRRILRIVSTDEAIMAQIVSCLRRLGFRHVVEDKSSDGATVVRVTGGVREHLRFFHGVDPAITRKRTIEGAALTTSAPLRVASIEPLGTDLPLVDITTGTGDFIANGVVSHNCFARPTHTYLDLDPGRGFETQIVVKVNAIELLRAELAQPSWPGEHIAMGTNTDPYQRAEGRYRLTRGVLEVLAEHRNPFSILTKSALVLRDLDLLTAASEVADVSVNLSIPTLDEEVWRKTEPGTPHPRRRLDAVAELNQTGVPSGVMIAPILPGISDAREQLEQVVAAAVDAGAAFVSPITLHLRPGVKELFLPWLEAERPDLAETYRRTYTRSYAPKTVRDNHARLVGELVDAHGCVSAPRRPARPGPEKRGPERVEHTGEQLSLDL